MTTRSNNAIPVTVENSAGGFAFIPGDMSFASAGVVALPGMAIDRAVLATPATLPDGFAIVAAHLGRVRRPLAAMCGLELRLPSPLPMAEFERFNGVYRSRLAEWGLLLDDGTSPLARTNVAPAGHAPREPSVVAFSYTVEAAEPAPTFVVSGVAELPERFSYPSDIVRRGETSHEALLDKARCVIDVVGARVTALGARWDGSTAAHLYSGHDVAFAVQRSLLPDLGVSHARGITWHDAAPPVTELELEMDVRRYRRELTLPSVPGRQDEEGS